MGRKTDNDNGFFKEVCSVKKSHKEKCNKYPAIYGRGFFLVVLFCVFAPLQHKLPLLFPDWIKRELFLFFLKLGVFNFSLLKIKKGSFVPRKGFFYPQIK